MERITSFVLQINLFLVFFFALVAFLGINVNDIVAATGVGVAALFALIQVTNDSGVLFRVLGSSACLVGGQLAITSVPTLMTADADVSQQFGSTVSLLLPLLVLTIFELVVKSSTIACIVKCIVLAFLFAVNWSVLYEGTPDSTYTASLPSPAPGLEADFVSHFSPVCCISDGNGGECPFWFDTVWQMASFMGALAILLLAMFCDWFYWAKLWCLNGCCFRKWCCCCFSRPGDRRLQGDDVYKYEQVLDVTIEESSSPSSDASASETSPVCPTPPPTTQVYNLGKTKKRTVINYPYVKPKG
jgi:hypothetical protein